MYSRYPLLGSLDSFDPLIETFPTHESIMEIMSLKEAPWNDTHHCSSFLPGQGAMSTYLEKLSSHFLTQPLQTPIMTHEAWSEGTMGNIMQTMPIEISIKPSVIENVHIGVTCSLDEIKIYTHLFQAFRDVFVWSYEEIPDIDPSIVVHEILTYPGAKPVHQWLCPVHPRKVVTIKGEVEKILKDGFIYPRPLTYWVSNIVSVTKKQGTIRVCVDYCYINCAYQKDNYPTPFIDQIIDECVGSEILSFMDGVFGYN